MKDQFEARPVHLAPIAVSLLVGVLCSLLVLRSSIELYAVTPFPEGAFGSPGNGLYFVVLAAAGASLLYLLVKRKSLRLVNLVVGFALTAAAFLLSTVYLYAAISTFDFSYKTLLVSAFSIALTVLVDFAIFRRHGKIYGLTILILGGALGAFLGMSIPTSSAVLILSFLAVYDVFAVYRGPLGKIVQTGLDQLPGLSLSFKDVQIGLGDLTFYSMLTSLVLVNASLVYCLASTVGVLVGVSLGLKILEKRGILPGLPLPVALGLAPLIVWVFL